MRTVTYTKNYYTIDELTGNAREIAFSNIIDHYQEMIMEFDWIEFKESLQSFLEEFDLAITDYSVGLYNHSYIDDNANEYRQDKNNIEINSDVEKLNNMIKTSDELNLTGVWSDSVVMQYFKDNAVNRVTYNDIHIHLSNITEYSLKEFMRLSKESLEREEYVLDHAYIYELEFDEDGEIY